MHMVFTNEGFLDVVIESRPDWNLSSYYAISYIHIFIYILYIYIHLYIYHVYILHIHYIYNEIWWNWSSCTKLALSASVTHGPIAQSEFSSRGFKFHSGQLSIATSKNHSVVNVLVHSATNMWLSQENFN